MDLSCIARRITLVSTRLNSVQLLSLFWFVIKDADLNLNQLIQSHSRNCPPRKCALAILADGQICRGPNSYTQCTLVSLRRLR